VKKEMNNKMFRQGDVLLILTKNLPNELVPVNNSENGETILAYGEVTGHSHIIKNGAVGYASVPTILCEYIVVNEPEVELIHQTHDPIKLKKGIYKKVIQSEYTPKEIRNVRD
jgi:hypothetical protein